MRIISGTHKGRRITAPKNLPVRPTTDMAKEALFNILNNQFYFDEIRVLDLFAGTGNMSFEFASRGCTDITSVDSHPGCIKFIGAKAAEWDFMIKAVKMDVFKFLEKIRDTYDLIFVDPPYDLSPEQFSDIHRLVYERNILVPSGTLIIEHSKTMDLSHLTHHTSTRRYGSSLFSFYQSEE